MSIDYAGLVTTNHPGPALVELNLEGKTSGKQANILNKYVATNCNKRVCNIKEMYLEQ